MTDRLSRASQLVSELPRALATWQSHECRLSFSKQTQPPQSHKQLYKSFKPQANVTRRVTTHLGQRRQKLQTTSKRNTARHNTPGTAPLITDVRPSAAVATLCCSSPKLTSQASRRESMTTRSCPSTRRSLPRSFAYLPHHVESPLARVCRHVARYLVALLI